MQFTTNYEFYPWEDINAIVCEDRGHADHGAPAHRPRQHGKGSLLPREDLDEIYAFIKKKNPGDPHHGYAAPEPKTGKKHKK